MANLTIAAGTQPFTKTAERPVSRKAGEGLNTPIMPLYFKASDSKVYRADSSTADTEKNTVIGISVSISETDQYVYTVADKGSIIDWGASLTKGTTWYLTGLGTIGEYTDVSIGDALVQLGHTDDNQDFIVDILHFNQTKSA